MEIKARGYYRQAGSAQAGQPVITRHEYDNDVRSAADTILVGRLLAGHRLITDLTKVIANALVPAMNYDLVCGGVTLQNDVAVTAATFTSTGITNSAAIEALGVSDTDRDIYLLVNSGFATAPAGAKVTLQLAQVPSD